MVASGRPNGSPALSLVPWQSTWMHDPVVLPDCDASCMAMDRMRTRRFRAGAVIDVRALEPGGQTSEVATEKDAFLPGHDGVADVAGGMQQPADGDPTDHADDFGRAVHHRAGRCTRDLCAGQPDRDDDGAGASRWTHFDSAGAVDHGGRENAGPIGRGSAK